MRGYLKELRENSNLLQNEVASKLDISESYYCLIENGERQKKISLSLLNKLADIFNVPIAQLIEEENKISQDRS